MSSDDGSHDDDVDGDDVLIDMQGVVFRYPEAAAPCLRDAALRVCAHARVLVVGANGSGKSTLLTLLAGRRRPQRGRVRVLGVDPFADTHHGSHIALVGTPWPADVFFGSTTVDAMTTPPSSSSSSSSSLCARRAELAAALHVNLAARLDSLSSGERRRVQLLHGLLQPARVVLLDECSTDLDVAERRALLQLVRRECAQRRGCCVYATHIFDHLDDWATHVAFVAAGRVRAVVKVRALRDTIERVAMRFFALCNNMNENNEDNNEEERDDVVAMLTATPTRGVVGGDDADAFGAATTRAPPAQEDSIEDNDEDEEDEEAAAVVTCAGLTYKHVFTDMHLTVHRGERVLLCGCNGAGKSTLLAMLGGRLFVKTACGVLRVCGRDCYDDMAALHRHVAYSGSWWATAPAGQMCVRALVCDDYAHNARAQRLARVLAVNLDWDVRHLSAGEQKRVQLLLHLSRPAQQPPARLLLLDEATSDLDLDQRQRLLQFLYEESVQRGVTVVYATHIFGGLRGWPTTAVVLDRTRRGVHVVWRCGAGGNGGVGDDAKSSSSTATIDLDALAEELVMLKAREAAERHVLTGASPQPSSSRLRSGGGGVHDNMDSHSRARDAVDDDDEDGGAGNGGRAWPRAGVGARGLTAKERRAQQAQAERVYGADDSADKDEQDGDDEYDEDKASKGTTTRTARTTATPQPLFALAAHERQALRSMVPRHVRRELAAAQHTAAASSSSSSLSSAPSRILGKSRRHGSSNDDAAAAATAASNSHSSTSAATVIAAAAGEQDGEDVVHKGSEVGAGVRAQTTPSRRRTPLDRIHQLDALRQQALMTSGTRRKGAGSKRLRDAQA